MSKLILNALIKAQHHIQNPIKDGKNPHFRNTYASINSVLEAVKGHLLECNIYIYQTMGRDELGDFVSTTLYHTDGDTLDCGKIYLRFKKDDMQQLGSAVTYARRYSLQALFGLGADDDDAECTINRPKQPADNKREMPKQSAPKPAAIDPEKQALLSPIYNHLSIILEGCTDEEKINYVKEHFKIDHPKDLGGLDFKKLEVIKQLLDNIVSKPKQGESNVSE